jgi:hypothetical protein
MGKREKKKRKEARSKDLQGRRSVGETVSPPTLESSNHTRTGGLAGRDQRIASDQPFLVGQVDFSGERVQVTDQRGKDFDSPRVRVGS